MPVIGSSRSRPLFNLTATGHAVVGSWAKSWGRRPVWVGCRRDQTRRMSEWIGATRVSVEMKAGQTHIEGFVQEPTGGRQPFYGWLQLGELLDRARNASADAPTQRPGPVHLLSIDGGGIRALIPALVLADIEERTGQGCAELFEMVVGTGTGGILALALTSLAGDSGQTWTARHLVDLIASLGPSGAASTTPVDSDSSVNALGTGTAFDARLARHFGDVLLSQAVRPVVVTAFDLTRYEQVLLSSRNAARNRSWDLPMSLAARATSAVPTFFPPLAIRLGNDYRDHLLVDGGLHSNNPALTAYHEAEKAFPGARIRLLSIGTGDHIPTAAWSGSDTWSSADWARPLISVVLDGLSRDVHARLGSVLDPGSYWRLQLPLTDSSALLDNDTADNVSQLFEHGQRVIAHFDRELDLICASLTLKR